MADNQRNCPECGCYVPEGFPKCPSCGKEMQVQLSKDNGCYLTLNFNGEEIKTLIEYIEIFYVGNGSSGRTLDGTIIQEEFKMKRRFTLMEV